MPVLSFTLHKTFGEEYYFRLRNIGGEVLLTSRNYSTFHKCVEEIYCLKVYRNFLFEEEFLALDVEWRFVLKNEYGITIARSGNYNSKKYLQQDMDLIVDSIHEAEEEDRSATVRFFRAINSKI